MRRRALERYGALLSTVAAAAWSGGAAPSDVFLLLEHVFAEGLQPTASFYSVAIEAAIGAPLKASCTGSLRPHTLAA